MKYTIGTDKYKDIPLLNKNKNAKVNTNKIKKEKKSKKDSAVAATAAIYSKIFLQLTEPEPINSIAVPIKEKEEKLILKIFEKIKFPMDDSQYWKMMDQIGETNFPPPLPSFISSPSSPSSSSCLPFSKILSKKSHLIGRLLSVWTAINNYKKLLNLPSISLDALENSLELSTDMYGTGLNSKLFSKASKDIEGKLRSFL